MTKPLAWVSLSLLLFCLSAFAQYGKAPNGYYPPNYNGDIYSGKVVAVSEDSTITIESEQKGRTERFAARLQTDCAVPSKDGKGMTALDIPIGTDLTAFFITPRKDTNEHLIIGIMFHSWNGHRVNQNAKKMYLCSSTPISHYWRCFNTNGVTCIEPREESRF